jgi:hypothetical protein
MINLSAVDAALLDALATYRVLSIAQAERMGIAGRHHLGERLRVLARQRYIASLEQGRMFGPRLHWLTPSGLALAGELAADRGEPIERIAAPRRLIVSSHLPQRVAIVDCHIAARAWARDHGAAVEWFRVEFEGNTKGELQKALKMPWVWLGEPVTYEPDAAGVIRLADGTRWLFALEVETGGLAHTIGNFQKRLAGRLGAFAANALEHGIDWPKQERMARLLFVFTDADAMRKAQRWATDAQGENLRRVFFATLPQLQVNFAENWQTVTGESALPFTRQIKAP